LRLKVGLPQSLIFLLLLLVVAVDRLEVVPARVVAVALGVIAAQLREKVLVVAQALKINCGWLLVAHLR
jgi:hypothetical protein